MNDEQNMDFDFDQDRKRRRLLLVVPPSKTFKKAKISSPSEPAPAPTPTPYPTPTPARYDYDQWKNSQRVAEQSLPLTSRPPAHMPVNASTSNGINGIDLVMVKANVIQANKQSVIKSNPNVVGKFYLPFIVYI